MDSLLIADVQNKAYLGFPYAFSDVCLIYPLTVGEIVGMGQLNYSSYLSIITIDEFDIINTAKKKGIEIQPEQINVFHYLIDSARQNYSFLLELKNAFRTFIREEINILFDEYLILIGKKPSEKRMLNENNFSDFQNIVRVQNKRTVKEDPPPDESPMRKKFRLKAQYRDSIKRNQKSNDPNAPDFCALMSSFSCYKSGITPQQLKDFSLFAFREDFERNQLKEKYQIDIDSILAGADSKKVKPEPWIKKTNN